MQLYKQWALYEKLERTCERDLYGSNGRRSFQASATSSGGGGSGNGIGASEGVSESVRGPETGTSPTPPSTTHVYGEICGDALFEVFHTGLRYQVCASVWFRTIRFTVCVQTALFQAGTWSVVSD